MALLASQAYDYIRHALAGDPSSEISVRAIANQAGRYWASMHDWKCMERFGRLNLRASLSGTDSLWTESSRTLTESGAFTSYTFVQGDLLEVTGGADATLGFYPVQSRSSANDIVLQTSIGSAADGDVDIDWEMDLSSIALPSDFRQLIGDPMSVSSVRALNMVPPEDVLAARSADSSSVDDTAYIGSIIWVPSASASGGVSIPRLEVWPPPGTNTSSAFSIHYRADWTDLTNDNSLLPIPAVFGMELLYLRILRAVARGWEEEDSVGMLSRLQTAHDWPEFHDAVRADGSVQTSFGQMRGGAASRRFWPMPDFTFQAPS
jgi:hypothetical protein